MKRVVSIGLLSLAGSCSIGDDVQVASNSPFVGEWSCTHQGSVQYPDSTSTDAIATSRFTITNPRSGEILVVSDSDAGSCPLKFSTEGATATLQGGQSCETYGAKLTYTMGSANVTSGKLTFGVRFNVSLNEDGSADIHGTGVKNEDCVRDSAPGSYRPSDGGPSDGPLGECNMLVNDSPHVVPQNQPTAPPAPLGGTITDGRYFLTMYNTFIGPDGQAIHLGDFWAADVMMVAGTTIQSIEGYRMEGLDHLPGIARTYTFAISGTTLTVTQTCPMPAEPATIEFTATADEFRWYVPAAGAMTELTFTKQ